MQIFIPKGHERHHQKKEVFNGNIEPASEVPSRIDMIHNQLILDYPNRIHSILIDTNGDRGQWIQQIHSSLYLEFLMNSDKRIQEGQEEFGNDFGYWNNTTKAHNALRGRYVRDTYTAFTPAIGDVALRSYNTVHTAGEKVFRGEVPYAYALTRPPGHHAMPDMASGYCYLANASIFANYLKAQGVRVGILDIDFHHGNGAQIIFYDDPSVITTSIHADPNRKFPYYSGHSDEIGYGKGKGTNLNIPLGIGVQVDEYITHLEQSCDFLGANRIEYLIVCLGFDTYEKDPISDFKISIDGFEKLGKMIHSMNLPTLFIQEGGYNTGDLGLCASSFFKSFIK